MINTRRTILSRHLKTLHYIVGYGFRASILPFSKTFEISTYMPQRSFSTNRGWPFRIQHRVICNTNNHYRKGWVATFCSAASPPPRSSGSWKIWVSGAVIAISLPVLNGDWGPLLVLKGHEDKIDEVVGKIDTVTEVVEEVAEGVERVAEEVIDKLPQDGKLRHALDLIENVAKKVYGDAHAVDELIHKLEAVEETVEKDVKQFVDAIDDQQGNVEIKEAE